MLLRQPGGFIRSTMPSLLQGLVFCAPLDEYSTGAVAVTRRDIVSGLHLTDVNTVTNGDGPLGQTAQFTNANSERLDAPVGALDGVLDQRMTCEIWAYPVSVPNFAGLIGKYGSGTTRGWAITQSPSAAPYTLRVTIVQAAGAPQANLTSAMPDSAWTQVAFVFDGTQPTNATRLLMYTNGTVRSPSFSGTIPSSVGSTERLRCGMVDALANPWNGRLSLARIWDRSLTPSEIAHLYNGGRGRAWPF